MKKLDIHPNDIDIVFLSHIHGDHVGGLDSILDANQSVTLYIPKSFPKSFKNNLKKYETKVIEVKKPIQICENVYSTGELGILIKEQSLIVHTDKGLIILTGCAHPEIANIVRKTKSLLNEDVLFVMGGFHLCVKSDKQIEKIIMDLKELKVRYVGPCHCSGITAQQLFEREYKNNYIKIGVGKVIIPSDFSHENFIHN